MRIPAYPLSLILASKIGMLLADGLIVYGLIEND